MMIKHKNFLPFLATFLVVALGIMAYMIYYQNQILLSMDKETLSLSKQSTSDETEDIENDLDNTKLDDVDKEVASIEAELDSSN